ncbi:MAG: hypothetical protein IJW89_05905 [Clostridia bacterium]|nr:hypothetical protein [Clostridia bacterium]
MGSKRWWCAILALTMLCALTACAPAPTDGIADGTTTAATTIATGGVPKAWSETTTTYPFSVTAPTNGAPPEEQLGYIQNENGTLTDKMSGVVFIDDTLQSLSVGAADCLAQEVSGLALTPDGDRVTATDADAFITYYLASGVLEAAVTVYAPTDMEKGDEMTVSVSADGKTYVPVTYTSHEPVQQNALSRRTYHFFNLPQGARYLKVQLPAPDKGALSPVQLDRVRVNNVHKMYYPLERLEDRAAATFYVDAQNGSDDNDGLSPATAYKSLAKISSRFFRPGDKILFKRGGTFVGNASLNGLGLAAHRIYIGAYGEGKDPIIAGRGGAALSVAMDFVTVENLEITNPSGLQGIEFAAAHTGENKGIVVQNCYIHDVNVSAATFSYSASGIYAYISNTTAPTWFEGMVVRNNTIHNTARCGIYFNTQWADRPGSGWGCSRPFYVDDDNGWWPAKNLNIEGNSVTDAHGDAVMVIGGRQVFLQRNFVSNAFCVDNERFSQVLQHGGGNRSAAALWTILCNDACIQYNEVSYTNLPTGGGDGEGYDIDCSQKNVLLQYNLSYRNAGGFLLVCDVDDFEEDALKTRHTVRYNLSVEDGTSVLSTSNTVTPIDFYNNTFILGGHTGLFSIYGEMRDYYFRNNIFYGLNGGLLPVSDTNVFQNIVFDNNLYAGGGKVPTVALRGKKEVPLEKYGYIVTDTNRTVELTFVGNPPATEKYVSVWDAMIAAYTPKTHVDGAYKTPSTVDINGDPIEAPFYGCVKPRA